MSAPDISKARVKAILKSMAKKNPSALRGVKIRTSGEPSIVDDLLWRQNPPDPKTATWQDKLGGRIWHNKKTTLLGKVAGSVTTAFSSPLDLLHVSRYNPPADAVQLYDIQALRHELGRAVDINSAKTPLRRDLYSTLIQPPILPLEMRLLHLPVKVATEFAADSKSSKDKRFKKSAGMKKMTPERFKTLATAIGSYAGGLAGPATHFLPPHLNIPLALTAGLMGSGLGAVAGSKAADVAAPYYFNRKLATR